MSNDASFFQEMRGSELEFLSTEEQKLRYCSTPPSYRDPEKDTQKRHQKIYFQFIKEHYDLFKKNHPVLFQRHAEFFEEMLKIDHLSRQYFANILEELDRDAPEVKQALLGKHQELTVVTKIVRYKKCERWGTTAHFDKSGLSLIWNSSDPNYDSLVLCSDTEHPDVNKLAPPVRQCALAGVNSVILIPGASLKEVGLNINPTLHGVLPLKNEYRYAVISFALVPDIDTKDIQTDFN